MFVYAIICDADISPVTGTGKYYIGKTVQKDLRRYLQQQFSDANKGLRGKTYLFNAIRKYGNKAFRIEPLISTLTSDEQLCQWETEVISLMRAQDPAIGYNLAGGGEGIKNWTLEMKQRQSELAKQRYSKMTPEERRASTAHMLKHHVSGFKHPPETLAKIKAVRAKQSAPRPRGFVMTEEHKRNIGKANASTWTPERRAEQAEQMRRNFQTQ